MAGRWIAFFLAVATGVYVFAWPRTLGLWDESILLHEAVRILRGARLYRDIFEISGPGPPYTMAAIFGVFGADMQVAHVTFAILYALIALGTYTACRALGANPWVAAAAGLVPIAIAYPAFPQKSHHWFGTCFSVLLAAVLLRRRTPPSYRWWMLVGACVGLVIVFQHQRGGGLGIGLALLLVLDWIARRRDGGSVAKLVGSAVALGAGAALVVVPVIAVLCMTAGPTAVLESLVLHYDEYRTMNPVTWGFFTAILEPYHLFPTLVSWWPIVGVVALGCFVASVWRREPAEETWSLAVCVALVAGGVASIAYFPDYIRLAVISPLMAIATAGVLTWLVARFGPTAKRVVTAAGVLTVAGLSVLAITNLYIARDTIVASRVTSFGRIDFDDASDAELLDALLTRITMLPTREPTMLAVPTIPGVYLLTGARNPTRYEMLVFPEYNSAAQVSEALAAVEAAQTPMVVIALWTMKPWKTHPVAQFLVSGYEPVALPGNKGLQLWERKDGRAPSMLRPGGRRPGVESKPRPPVGRP